MEPKDVGGISHDHRTSRNIFGNHRTCTHHGPLANGNWPQDHRMRANISVIAQAWSSSLAIFATQSDAMSQCDSSSYARLGMYHETIAVKNAESFTNSKPPMQLDVEHPKHNDTIQEQIRAAQPTNEAG